MAEETRKVTFIDADGNESEQEIVVVTAETVDLKYTGRDGHYEDRVGPYNEGDRRLSKGQVYTLPKELAEALMVYEGWNPEMGPSEDDGEGQDDGGAAESGFSDRLSETGVASPQLEDEASEEDAGKKGGK